MSGTEVTQKLRSDIKNKLISMGTYIDNELPDYIMVMVANQRSRYQLMDELSLFLNENTDQFVDWLHEALKRMQVKVNSSPGAAGPSPSPSPTLGPGPGPVAESPATLALLKAEPEKKREKEKKEKKPVEIRKKSTKVPKVVSVKPVEKQVTLEEEVVLKVKSNEDEDEEEDELLLEENSHETTEDEVPSQEEAQPQTEEEPVVKEPVRKRLGAKSTIGAIVKHEQQFVDEEEEEAKYNPRKPVVGSVASIVRVTERKSSVPLDRQATTNLFKRATKDALKSINKRRIVAEEEEVDAEYLPTSIKQRLGAKAGAPLDDQDLRHYLKQSNQRQVVNSVSIEKTDEFTEVDVIQESKAVEVEDNEALDSGDILDTISQEIQHQDQDQFAINPRFIVTLDGIESTLGESFVFDEEVDDEFMEEDGGEEGQVTEMTGRREKKERCKYWPSCKRGDGCSFVHPSLPCTSFPTCRFGDKCLYVHPNCKFDAKCSRKDCPFIHANKRKVQPKPLIPAYSSGPCKYFPNCINPACPFTHPKPCNFGSSCRSAICPFSHPPPAVAPYPASKPSQAYKWKARQNMSERKFARDSALESMPVPVEKSN